VHYQGKSGAERQYIYREPSARAALHAMAVSRYSSDFSADISACEWAGAMVVMVVCRNFYDVPKE
jgi:hypothetical protein